MRVAVKNDMLHANMFDQGQGPKPHLRYSVPSGWALLDKVTSGGNSDSRGDVEKHLERGLFVAAP
jgi:hypothetical protein